MNKKILRMLLELSKNSRITTKALSKILKMSQQSISYHLNRLKRKKIILGHTTIVDPAKLGLIDIMVGFNFSPTKEKTKKEVIDFLYDFEPVTSIYEAEQEVDLLVEFCCPNLSSFNKKYTDLYEKFDDILITKFIYPIIVTHKFPQNYLLNIKEHSSIIISGDRKVQTLDENEKKVLSALIEEPTCPIIEIAKKTDLSAGTVTRIKKKLEKDKIIRGYSCYFDHTKLNIHRYILLLNFMSEGVKEIEKFTEFAKENPNVIWLEKIIGNFQIAITVEELKKMALLKEIRENFIIKDYSIIDIGEIHKFLYVPEKIIEKTQED